MKFNYAGVAITCFLLLISLNGLPLTQAQHTSSGWASLVSPISIDSPTNTTYTTNHVTLTFTVKSLSNLQFGNFGFIMTYSLDGKEAVTVPTTKEFVPVCYTDDEGNQRESQFFSYYVNSGTVELEDLQSGQHCLTVFGQYTLNSDTGLDSQTIYFSVDDETAIVPANVGEDGMSESESVPNMLYAAVGVFSLVTVITYALFVKCRSKSKNMHSLDTKQTA